jgi:hypothetical protein
VTNDALVAKQKKIDADLDKKNAKAYTTTDNCPWLMPGEAYIVPLPMWRDVWGYELRRPIRWPRLSWRLMVAPSENRTRDGIRRWAELYNCTRCTDPMCIAVKVKKYWRLRPRAIGVGAADSDKEQFQLVSDQLDALESQYERDARPEAV